MKMSFLKLMFALVVGLGLFTACKKQLEEYNPTGLTADAVYSTPAGFETLVNAAYAYTRFWYGKEEGYGLTEMGTDLWINGSDNRQPEILNYLNLQSNQAFVDTLWRKTYQAINVCNAGVSRISKVAGYDETRRKTREGELRFLRAFYYWHIVEMWGGVHFTLEESKTPQTTANKTPVETFYKQILEDLNFAVNNLQIDGRISADRWESFFVSKSDHYHRVNVDITDRNKLADTVLGH